MQQGPHINEDQFFDAIEDTLDKMETLEKKLRNVEVATENHVTHNNVSGDDVRPRLTETEHRMYKQVF